MMERPRVAELPFEIGALQRRGVDVVSPIQWVGVGVNSALQCGGVGVHRPSSV